MRDALLADILEVVDDSPLHTLELLADVPLGGVRPCQSLNRHSQLDEDADLADSLQRLDLDNGSLTHDASEYVLETHRTCCEGLLLD